MMNMRGRAHIWGKWPLGLFAAALFFLIGAPTAEAQTTVTLDAMLIHASDRPAAMDRRLDKVEYRLRRMFRFEHYGYFGGRETLITLPSQTTVALGHGYDLVIDATGRGDRVRADVQWRRGRDVLIRTTVSQKRGVPTILGGPTHGDGTLILVLEFK